MTMKRARVTGFRALALLSLAVGAATATLNDDSTVPVSHAATGATTRRPPPIGPIAALYLNDVLTYMQANAVRTPHIGWVALRRQALARAAGARSTADTYPALRWAVGQLGDHHSAFLSPVQARALAQGRAINVGAALVDGVVVEVFPGSPAARAGVRMGDTVVAVNGRPLEPSQPPAGADARLRLTLRRPGQARLFTVTLTPAPYDLNRPPAGRRLVGAIGYLDLPMLIGGEMTGSYATLVQGLIRRLDRPSACGWVVDLRRDHGGDMWPMLAGVGPLLGEGTAGSFIGRQGVTRWSYRAGQAQLGGQVQVQVPAPYTLAHPFPPVAVLTSRLTVSSGEAIAIAFRGRPRTRSFGEPTAGLPTANVTRPLLDGAVLVLTTALDADRTGRSYDDRIAPDQPVRANWVALGTGRDPVLQAAWRWLRRQTACAT